MAFTMACCPSTTAALHMGGAVCPHALTGGNTSSSRISSSRALVPQLRRDRRRAQEGSKHLPSVRRTARAALEDRPHGQLPFAERSEAGQVEAVEERQEEEASSSLPAETSSEDQPESAAFQLLSSAILVLPALAAEGSSYSQASYYTSLGLFLMSVPGVWSLIKRSTKSKIVKKTFSVDGPGKPNAKPLGAIAGEITAVLTRRNYKVADRGEVARFEGVITPSRSQASFLVFCTALSLASIALVLTITAPEGGSNWYWLILASPLSGIYYWRNATRTEEVKVKMVIADDEQSADIVIQGGDDEVERLRKEIGLMEKGMVYVKGILE